MTGDPAAGAAGETPGGPETSQFGTARQPHDGQEQPPGAGESAPPPPEPMPPGEWTPPPREPVPPPGAGEWVAPPGAMPPPGALPGAVPSPGAVPPPAGQPRRLVRRVDDRLIAGVASGLGAYLGIDTVIVRIAFVALSFLGGVGVVAYVAAWLLVPASDGSEPVGLAAARRLGDGRGRGRIVAGAILLAVAVIILADNLSSGHAGLFWGLGLIIVGVLLLAEETWPSRAASAVGPDQASQATAYPSSSYGAAAFAPAPAGAPRATETGWTPSPGYTAVTPPAGAAPTTPTAGLGPRSYRRSILGWLTTAVALLAVGVAALLDTAGVISISAGSMLSLVLIVLGLGLIVGAWFGRSRALIALGAVVLPFAAAASLIQVPIAGGTGDRTVTASTPADLKSEYRFGAGQLVLDLSHLDTGGASRSVTASVAFGQLKVVAPRNAGLDIRGRAGAGDLDLLGHIANGVQVDTAASAPAPPGGGTLHLDLRVGFGQVRVVQADALQTAP